MYRYVTHRFTKCACALAAIAVVGWMGLFTVTHSAAADEEQQGGRVVNISPQGEMADHNDADQAADAEHGAHQDEAAQPAFWLGLQGAVLDSPVLRTHLQLADDVGVVVEQIVPHSPAEKAGLRRHDVLISVGGEQITDMSVLQKAVADSQGKPIEIKFIRLAKEEMVTVTPEERPADIAAAQQGGDVPGIPGDAPMGDVARMLEQLQQRGGMPRGLRLFGPGMVFNGQFNVNQVPNGFAVTVTRENDGPAKITVTKDGQTWTVEGDDAEALKKLPDDVRPFVEQMLHAQGGPPLFQNGPNGLQGVIPGGMGQFDMQAFGQHAQAAAEQAQEVSQQLQQRMEELEKQLEDLQRRFDDGNSAEGTNPAADPSIQ